MQLDALASGVQSQATHLRQRLAAAPAPHSETRNPFAFAAAERPQPAAVEKAVDAERLPVIQTSPEPNLVLLGLAEDGSTRTAMIESGDDLVMATEGQSIVGRYRVAKISPDGIELVDLRSRQQRIQLQTPASLLCGFRRAEADRGALAASPRRAADRLITPTAPPALDRAEDPILCRGARMVTSDDPRAVVVANH